MPRTLRRPSTAVTLISCMQARRRLSPRFIELRSTNFSLSLSRFIYNLNDHVKRQTEVCRTLALSMSQLSGKSIIGFQQRGESVDGPFQGLNPSTGEKLA